MLEHMAHQIVWVIVLLTSLFLAAFRDNLIVAAVKAHSSLVIWDYLYFALTGIFLVDLILNLVIYKSDLWTKRPEYKLEAALQVFSFGLTIYYAVKYDTAGHGELYSKS